MRLQVISVSGRQPDWVQAGFEDFARRLKGSCTLSLTEIPLPKRGKASSVDQLMAKEGQRILAAIPKGAHVVALDETGRQHTTAALAARLQTWMAMGRAVALLIGGPDGLARECLQRADESWSISALTLPHGLVRIVVAEALYRAWSLLEHHPYHRD